MSDRDSSSSKSESTRAQTSSVSGNASPPSSMQLTQSTVSASQSVTQQSTTGSYTPDQKRTKPSNTPLVDQNESSLESAPGSAAPLSPSEWFGPFVSSSPVTPRVIDPFIPSLESQSRSYPSPLLKSSAKTIRADLLSLDEDTYHGPWFVDPVAFQNQRRKSGSSGQSAPEIIGNHAFFVRPRYKVLNYLGAGSFGVVVSATDNLSTNPSQNVVAIKKIAGFQKRPGLVLRTVREVRIMAYLHHDNVINLIDLIINNQTSSNINEIYLVLPLMHIDLSDLLRNKPLTAALVQRYFYHLVHGIAYLHSANVVHRDLKPANLLINEESHILKISDFSLTRVYDPDADRQRFPLTEDVVSLLWRAPEVIYNNGHYDKSIDVWSAGCILGEMMSRRPMFKGKNKLDQLKVIYNVLGSQPQQVIDSVENPDAFEMLLTELDQPTAIPWQSMIPGASEDYYDILDKMLTFTPEARITAIAALNHTYFSDIALPQLMLSTTPLTENVEELDQVPVDTLKEQLIDVVKAFKEK